MIWWAAFMVGLVGSLHCVGMCGPIAIALPYSDNSRVNTFGNVLLYNFGRIITYGVLGLMFGILGASFSLGGFQQWMSIIVGVLFFLAAVFSFNIENSLMKWGWTGRIFFFVKSRLSIFLQKKSMQSLFFIGLLNGLLPCGLVYMALAGALVSGSVIDGVGWMVMFGLGTVPLMMVVALSGNFFKPYLRRFYTKAYPAFLLAFALLFIGRGLGVEIPDDWYWVQMLTGKSFCH